MRVCCVGYLHGSGGAERQICMLANNLAERGHEVSLIVLSSFNKKYEIRDNVKIIDCSQNDRNNKLAILHRYISLKQIYKRENPDVTIHYWFQSAYLTAFMNKSYRGKVIYSERGDPGDAEYNGILELIRKLAIKKIDGFVFQSEGARDYFGNDITDRSIVIHNSVAVPADNYLEPCANRENVIVNVGRLHPQKNQKLLISAFAKVAQEFPEYRLNIYGDGVLREQLEAQIEKLDLRDRVFLKGTTKEILNVIYPAKLFVLSSDYEGLPNALLESMAIGIPSISTDCRPGGARSIIEDGVNGWITPIGDETALANKIREVLLNDSLARKVAINGMSVRATHSSYEVFGKWERFLQLIDERR